MPVMATVTHLSEQDYRELALADPDRAWELRDGVLVEKPPMSMTHNRVAFFLGHLLQNHLDRKVYQVNVNGDRARLSPGSFFIPDVMVIPVAYQQPIDPRALGIYSEPLPFVVEIWPPSTGGYDLESKLAGYRRRGDLEIWFIQPYERTLSASRRHPDGSYSEERYTGGIVPVASLPGVVIDFGVLLDG
jgi:Uma2 family endonuclease